MRDRWIPPPRARAGEVWRPGGAETHYPPSGSNRPPPSYYPDRYHQHEPYAARRGDRYEDRLRSYDAPYNSQGAYRGDPDDYGEQWGSYPYAGPSRWTGGYESNNDRARADDRQRGYDGYAARAGASSNTGYSNDGHHGGYQTRSYSAASHRPYHSSRSPPRHGGRSSAPPNSGYRDAPSLPTPVLRAPLWRDPARHALGGGIAERSDASSAGSSRVLSRGGGSIPPPKRSGPALPDEQYLRVSSLRSQAILPEEGFFPKLVILDLNGALVYRTARSGEKRKAYPRPYLASFLEYLFLPETSSSPHSAKDLPNTQSKGAGRKQPVPNQTRPYEVFVWSSAQPHNVRSMVEVTFGLKWPEGIWETEKKRDRDERLSRGEGRILKVWARDTLGLSEAEYGKKVQTFKDLRKVIRFFENSHAVEHAYLPEFDLKNCLLIDDSPLKAVLQPWNQLVIPEYDKKEFQDSRDIAARLARDPTASTEGLDEILLGVIGILEEMRTVENVPAWIRSGGLLSCAADTTPLDLKSAPHTEELPSFGGFRHWYDRPEQLAHWIARGKAALKRRGITASIGLDAQVAAMSPPPRAGGSEGRDQPSIDQQLEDEQDTNRERPESPLYSPSDSPPCSPS